MVGCELKASSRIANVLFVNVFSLVMTTLISSSIFPFIRRQVYGVLQFIDQVRLPFAVGKSPSIVIFAYHSISSDDWRFGVSQEEFMRQIEFLLKIRKPVSLSDVHDHIVGTRMISDPSFAICFDDGYRDILSVREFLAERGIRPALFVLSDTESADITELGIRREFLRPEDIRTLYKDGWDIGCHSATHGDFWNMDAERIQHETIDAKKKLESDNDISIQYFAYPRGRYTEEVIQYIRKAGYELALSMDDGYIDTSTNPYAVPRVGVDRTHTFEEFPGIFSPSVIRLRRVVKWIIGRFL